MMFILITKRKKSYSCDVGKIFAEIKWKITMLWTKTLWQFFKYSGRRPDALVHAQTKHARIKLSFSWCM